MLLEVAGEFQAPELLFIPEIGLATPLLFKNFFLYDMLVFISQLWFPVNFVGDKTA